MNDDPRPRIYERLAQMPPPELTKPAPSRIEWVFWGLVVAALVIFLKGW